MTSWTFRGLELPSDGGVMGGDRKCSLGGNKEWKVLDQGCELGGGSHLALFPSFLLACVCDVLVCRVLYSTPCIIVQIVIQDCDDV